MPEAAAKLVGWPSGRLQIATVKPLLAAGGPLKLGIAEPRRETASLAATMLLGEALATSDDELPALVKTFRSVVKTSSTGELLRTFGDRVNAGPASEQAVLAYNATNPPLKLVAVQLDPAAPLLDYPYAIRSGITREIGPGGRTVPRASCSTSAAAEKLASKAFRGPEREGRRRLRPPRPPPVSEPVVGATVDDPARVQRALGLWAAANSPSRTCRLVRRHVVDGHGRCRRQPGQPTRTDVMVSAAQERT